MKTLMIIFCMSYAVVSHSQKVAQISDSVLVKKKTPVKRGVIYASDLKQKRMIEPRGMEVKQVELKATEPKKIQNSEK